MQPEPPLKDEITVSDERITPQPPQPPAPWWSAILGRWKAMPRQNRIIWAGVFCLTCLALYVPWKLTWSSGGSRPMGYGFLFYPPELDREHWSGGVEVDTTRLLISMGIVAGITAAAVVLTREKTEPPK